MRSAIRRWREAQQHAPGRWGILANPFFLARRALAAEMARVGPQATGRLLDVGCGTQPYRASFAVDEYVGLEIDTPEARARGIADEYYDGGRFPFGDATFDVVLCNQVLEHVFVPEAFVAEIHRVLVPGGRLILTVPFVWDEHEQPHDYARYSSFGLRALLERGGLVIAEQRKLLADAAVLFQLVNAYLYKVLRPDERRGGLLLVALLMAPVSALGALAGRVLPVNPDLFLDQSVVAVRPLER